MLLLCDRFLRDEEVAAPDHKNIANRFQRSPDVFDIGVGTKIARPIAADLTCNEGARERLVRDDDVGIALIVLQADVIAGFELLDDVGLENQRLDFGVGDDDLKIGRLRQHLLDPGAERA